MHLLAVKTLDTFHFHLYPYEAKLPQIKEQFTAPLISKFTNLVTEYRIKKSKNSNKSIAYS